MLLKNFGVTRHGRVLSYDYDELCPLVDLTFREAPPARNEERGDGRRALVQRRRGRHLPSELRTFLGLQGSAREAFLREHGDLFGVELWHTLQERLRRGEVLSFYPYDPARRLRQESSTIGVWTPAPS